jgi:flagellar biosynthesis/type III secretory pathway chaperone
MAHEQLSLCAGPQFPDSDLTEYMGLLSERRRIINRIQELSTAIQVIRNSSDPNPATESHLHKTVSAMAALAARITDVDSHNKRLLQEKMGETKQALLKLRLGSSAKKAYNPGNTQNEGIFLDYTNP